MKSLTFTVSVDENNDYIGEYELEVPFEDEMYAKLVSLAEECSQNGQELSEDLLEERLPDVSSYISGYADSTMTDYIDIEDGEDISSFMCYVQYPEDICELILED